MEQNSKMVIKDRINRALIILLVSIVFFSTSAIAQTSISELGKFSLKQSDLIQSDILQSDVLEREIKSNNSTINPYSPIINKELKNGVSPSLMLPDKLAVPERDHAYKTFSGSRSKEIKSKEQLKEQMLDIGYYSKGIDGYYKKSIDMGYVGEGWVETKELRAAVARVRSEISRNLGTIESSDPAFLESMNNSSSSVVRALGSVLNVINNGAKKNCYLPDSPGYRGSNPIVSTVATPGRYKYTKTWD